MNYSSWQKFPSTLFKFQHQPISLSPSHQHGTNTSPHGFALYHWALLYSATNRHDDIFNVVQLHDIASPSSSDLSLLLVFISDASIAFIAFLPAWWLCPYSERERNKKTISNLKENEEKESGKKKRKTFMDKQKGPFYAQTWKCLFYSF